jgi:group I intron endonuclease
MFYTVYKITNKINNKFYIGKHQTENLNDAYMGSGKLIKAAIKKYGMDNFTKEILYVFDNEHDMNLKEKELVILSENSYNICEGGKGGFGYINSNLLQNTEKAIEVRRQNGANTLRKLSAKNRADPSFYDKWYNKVKESAASRPGTFTGRKHSDHTKKLMSEKASVNMMGDKNHRYGTFWITDGENNKQIKKEDTIPTGWYKGRVIINR